MKNCYLYVWTGLLACCLPGAGGQELQAQNQEPEAVLGKLRNYDKIYAASLTARGKATEPASQKAPYLGPRHKSWVLSRQGEKMALVERLREKNLRYQPPSDFVRYADDMRGISFDKQGNLSKSLLTYKALSFEGDRSAWVEVWTVHQINSAGKLISENENRSVMRYGPEDATLKFPLSQVMWTLGRGFSSCLESASTSTPAGDGRLLLEASGFCLSEQQTGRWELTIEPDSQYLVRKAVFYSSARPDQPYLSIVNSGRESRQEVVFPKQGQCTLHRVRDRITTFEFDDVRLAADDAVIREARAQTDNLSSPRTLTMDHTVAPPTSNYIDHRGLSSDRRPPMEVKSPFRTWIVVLLVAGTVVLFVILRMVRK